MLELETKRTTEVTEDNILTLTGSELLGVVNHMLTAQGKPQVPPDAEVYVTIPGGGDYSNMDLDIDKDMPVKIRWIIHRREQA